VIIDGKTVVDEMLLNGVFQLEPGMIRAQGNFHSRHFTATEDAFRRTKLKLPDCGKRGRPQVQRQSGVCWRA
jgi:hypothetical protein